MQDVVHAPASPIDVRAFFLADHADAVNGKIYVTGGGWDRIFARSIPMRHAHMSVVLQLMVPWNATLERHAFEIDLRDEERRSIIPTPIGGEFEVGLPPGARPGDESSVVAVLNVDNLEYPRAGHYRVVLAIDGQEVKSIALRVVEVPGQPVTGRPPQ